MTVRAGDPRSDDGSGKRAQVTFRAGDPSSGEGSAFGFESATGHLANSEAGAVGDQPDLEGIGAACGSAGRL